MTKKAFWCVPLFLLAFGCSDPKEDAVAEARARRAKIAAARPQQEALARQVEIQGVTVRPWTNAEGRTFQSVHVKWLNRGPKPIASIYVKLDVYDAQTGQKTDDSTDERCVYASSTDADRIAPGQVAEDSPDSNKGYLLPLASQEPERPVRVEVTPQLADEQTDPEYFK